MTVILWGAGIFALLMLVLVAIYVVVGLRLRRLDQTSREALVEAEEAQSFADLPCGTTHYRLARSGRDAAPLIVLVHGFSTPSFVYAEYFEPLTAAGYNVLSLDLLGRGFSDRPNASYGVETYVAQIRELLDHLGHGGPAHFVGYSMGGAIVSCMAERHPERVASLCLIASAGLAVPTGRGASFMSWPLVGEWIFRVLGTTALKDQLTDDFKYAPDPASFAALFDRQFQYRGLDHALLDTVRAFGRGEFNVDFTAPVASNIPVLAYFSEDDGTIPIASADRLAELNPKAAIHRFADGGHGIGFGKAKEIAAGIIAFLKD